jgi:chromosome segregation ATPase
MRFFQNILVVAVTAMVIAASAPVMAQQAETEAVLEAADRFETLVGALDEYNDRFPELIEQIRANQITEEEADEQIDQAIEELKTAQDEMKGGGEIDMAIDDYREILDELIAEGNASDVEAIRDVVPALVERFEAINDADEERAEAVSDAKNLIAALEKNRETLSYLMRAQAAMQGADLLVERVDEFVGVVDRGKSSIKLLREAANP